MEINLKKNDKKIFKLTPLKIILKDKKDIFFYSVLFLLMGIVIFFWALNFKNYSKDFKKVSEESKEKYQEIMSTYGYVKEDIDSSLKSIKESFEKLKSSEDKNNKEDSLGVEDAKLQENLLLDSITDEQKKLLIESFPNQIQNELSQEELKVILDSLNKK